PEHDLDDPAGVAQVDEGDAAVVAAAGYPARQRHRLAVLLGAQRARLVRSDHFLLSLSITAPLIVPARPARYFAPGRPGTDCWPARRRWSSAARGPAAPASHPAASGRPGPGCPSWRRCRPRAGRSARSTRRTAG